MLVIRSPLEGLVWFEAPRTGSTI